MVSQIDAEQIWLLSPQLSMVILGFLVLGLDLATRRRKLPAVVAIIGLVVPAFFTFSLATNLFVSNRPTTGFFGMLVVDQYALFFDFLFLVIGFGVMLLSYQYVEKYLRAT